MSSNIKSYLMLSILGVLACYRPSHAAPPRSVTTPPDKTGETEYQDRLILPSQLPAEASDEEDDEEDRGPPRSLHFEVVAHHNRYAYEKSTEWGVGAGGYISSTNFGTFSGEMLLFQGRNTWSDNTYKRGTLMLWQRGLPMPGGWSVDNGLGVINTPMPDLLRNQYRFILPSVPMLGFSSDWQQRDGLRVQAAVGRSGVFQGARLSGFEAATGQVMSAGTQWRWSPQVSSAASVLLTDGQITPDAPGFSSLAADRSRALFTAHRWNDARHSVQLNTLSNSVNTTGLWLDARSVRNDYTHRYGVFNLPSGLTWGVWPINNDVRGSYYRMDYQRARIGLNASVDRVQSISGNGFDGWYVNGYMRYQANARMAYGSGLIGRHDLRDRTGTAQSMQVFLDRQWQWGQTRWQYEYAQENTGSGSWRLLMDHAWRMREDARLSMSASIGELAYQQGRRTRVASLAANGGYTLSDTFSVDGSLRWTESSGDEESRGLDLNLGWQWRLASRWALRGHLMQTRVTRRSPFVLDPLSQQTYAALPADRSAFLSLRYEYSAGRAPGVIGGPPHAATGRISGSIYLDENGDGQHGANEQPASNLLIVLDQRFTTTTDSQGRFRFDAVAVGHHSLQVIPDNLPLPWAIDEDQAPRSIDVEVRQGTRVDIGARRPH